MKKTDEPGAMRLPPLESLRFFEVAGRHESFAEAARRLDVTAAAVAHRIKVLEAYLGTRLFERHAHGITLSARGKSYLREVQRTLSALHQTTERHRDVARGNILKVVAVEAVAEMWLMPRLVTFQSAHPDIVIELETDHYEVDPSRREFDVWVAFTNEIKSAVQCEVLFEETLVPVCSPGFLASYGRPEKPADLREYPLLYDLAWHDYWAWWFAGQGAEAPDLSKASGFRLYSMMVQAAATGMGVAIGHSMLVAPELERGSLVSLLGPPVAAPARYFLATGPGVEGKPEVEAFREWVVDLARGMKERTESGVAGGHAV